MQLWRLPRYSLPRYSLADLMMTPWRALCDSNAERSIGFWLDAARVAIARGGAAEAISQLHRGLAQLGEIFEILGELQSLRL